ncbi:MAG: sirohydrochlorin chelatase [Microcystaceae cyanobacterium]
MSAQSLNVSETSLTFPPLPLQRPLLIIGHGTRDKDGKQAFLDFVAAYQAADTSRPVIPCFLELTDPLISQGIKQCVAQGYTDINALPFLLFAARHTKFDVTSALDQAKQDYPSLNFHYGRHFGNHPLILDLWKSRLAQINSDIAPEETVLLVVGRGSSDPDANSDVYKFSRLLWEGSHYQTVETCFIGITHPRFEMGLQRAQLYQPKRIIILPHFLFTGALVKKIDRLSAEYQAQYPDLELVNLAEIGFTPELLSVVREREIETQLGQTMMNCEMCKFRRLEIADHSHHHHHHEHDHPIEDPYEQLDHYHQRIWQVP